jgi:hypothetical protein
MRALADSALWCPFPCYCPLHGLLVSFCLCHPRAACILYLPCSWVLWLDSCHPDFCLSFVSYGNAAPLVAFLLCSLLLSVPFSLVFDHSLLVPIVPTTLFFHWIYVSTPLFVFYCVVCHFDYFVVFAASLYSPCCSPSPIIKHSPGAPCGMRCTRCSARRLSKLID